MSSAILYLAIVAIWAVVLVPRWLRPSHTSGTLESNLAEPLDASPQGDLADPEEDKEGEEGSPADAERAAEADAERAAEADAERAAEADAERAEHDSEVRPVPGQEREASPAGPTAAEQRTRILQARRRTLTTLIVLAAGAVAIAVAHLAAWWVVIPPSVMLAGFVLLLREAGRIDAERARVAAAQQGHRTDARGRAQAGAPMASGDEQHAATADHGQPGPASAEIIDISARVGDQLYDQYADAEVRAVGD